MSTEGQYEVENARSEDQAEEMHRLGNKCFLCWPRPGSVLYDNGLWYVKKNDFPYKGTILHLLIVPHIHVKEILEVMPERMSHLHDAIGWCREMLPEMHQGYSIALRNGDMKATGATVSHLHLHLIVGDSQAAPVRFKMSNGGLNG